MRTFLSILWHFPFFGFMQALAFFLAGLSQCLTIIFIPAGLGTMQISFYLFNPFNKALINKDDLVYIYPMAKRTSGFTKGFNILNRILYFIPGCFAAASMIFSTIGFFISIVGIPCGLVYARTIPAFFNPINKVCVTREEAEKIEQIKRAQRSDDNGGNGGNDGNGESCAKVNNEEPAQQLIGDVKEYLVPASKKYYSIYIYAFAIIESIASWLFLVTSDSGYMVQTIVYNILIMTSLVLLTIKCQKKYIAPILALTLINIAYIVSYIHCNNIGIEPYLFSSQLQVLSIVLMLILGIVAFANKNYNIRNSALIFIVISAFNLLWSNVLVSFIIHKLYELDAINLWPTISITTSIVLSVCELAAFALLVVGLYKEDQQVESSNGANLGEGDKDNSLDPDVLESLFD